MSIVVKLMPNDRSNPPGKLADAELHFTDGELDGLKLIGFSIWERRTGGGRNVTFPARQYAVNGERRSFALLRPITDIKAQERIRDLVLQAPRHYDTHRGTFALRSPVRPNPIAASVVKLVGVDGPRLSVIGLDCLDGTPLIDIKPYFASVDAVPDAVVGWHADRKA